MKVTDLHPSALAFCPACCTTETPRFDYNTLLVDPVHTSCGCEYEFLKPTELHRRTLAEQADAVARALGPKLRSTGEIGNGSGRRALSVRDLAKAMTKRPSTIRAQIAAGNVVVIPNSKPVRISPAELARLQSKGLPDLPGAPPGKRKGRPRRAGPRQRLMPNGESGELPGELRSFRSPPAKS